MIEAKAFATFDASAHSPPTARSGGGAEAAFWGENASGSPRTTPCYSTVSSSNIACCSLETQNAVVTPDVPRLERNHISAIECGCMPAQQERVFILGTMAYAKVWQLPGFSCMR